MTNEKRCTKCKILKPLGEFHKQERGKFGRTARCIECVNAEHRAYKLSKQDPSVREKRARKQMLFSQGLKECSKCNEVKVLDEFFMTEGRRIAACKVCCLRKHRDWKENNKQHMFEYVREYTSRPEVRKKKNERRERLRAESPRMVMQTTLAHGLKRVRTEHPATIDDLMQKWREQDGRCALSDVKMTWNQGKVLSTSVSLDRIDQEQGYSADNLRLICYSVNAFRGRMSDAEMVSMARAIVAKADAKAGPSWKPYLVHSEVA